MASSARIDELRKKFDENPRRYFAPLANEYRKSGDLEQAIFICQEFLPQQPGHMSGHIVYGQTLFELGRLDEAQAVFETALSLDPENLIALRHLGDIARQGQDLTAARIWYQRVLEADPRNEEIAQLMIALLASPEPEPEPPAFESLPLSREPLRAEASPPPDEEPLIVERTAEPEEASASAGAGEQDFLEFEPFNAGTFQTPVPSVTPEPMAHPATDIADTADMSGMAATPAEPGFDLGAEDAPFEADPYAIASPPPEPEIELATDLRLGIPSDEPVSPEEPSAGSPPTFVTETMAELYLRQGHVDAALGIYRQLVDQRPSDPELQVRLRAVEDRLQAELTTSDDGDAVDEPANADQVEVASAPVYGGPTIREFLAAIAANRSPLAAPESEQEPEPESQHTSELEEAAASEPEPEYEPAPRPPSASGATLGDSIAEIFSGEQASSGSESAPLHGVPAHAAKSELSLDHVFKGNAPPPPPPADAFSFDQFFAEEMNQTGQHSTRDGAPPPQPADDIAQFNAWLNGLKKT